MAIEKVALTKNRGVPRDAIRMGLRAHIVGKYVIYFRISQDDVIIVRVLHSARDTKKLTFADEFD